MDQYFTIEKQGIAEFKDRGSKFIAHAYPVLSPEEFKKYHSALKKEHPKAVHHCFAYRIGVSKDIFRVSDDGEPSGTAGKPILGQLDSKGITNTAIIVVRYFGGTLLGVPGLINAYKTSASLVLQTVPVILKQIEVPYIIHFDHQDVNEIMRIIKQYNCNVYDQELQLFPFIKMNIPMNRKEEILYQLNLLRNVAITEIV